MIARIKSLLTGKHPASPLEIAQAASQYKAAQLCNDPKVREAARAALDRAYGGWKKDVKAS